MSWQKNDLLHCLGCDLWLSDLSQGPRAGTSLTSSHYHLRGPQMAPAWGLAREARGRHSIQRQQNGKDRRMGMRSRVYSEAKDILVQELCEQRMVAGLAVGLAATAAHPAPGSTTQTGGDRSGPSVPPAGAPSRPLCETSPAWDSPLGPTLSPWPFT